FRRVLFRSLNDSNPFHHLSRIIRLAPIHSLKGCEIVSKPIIYFLCTGNSCRSQMAEGFGKKYLHQKYDVYSAGIEAHGVNPKAVKSMKEKGVDISRQTAELIDRDILQRADYVITLCGDANEKCPITHPHVRKDLWGFTDPAKARGTEEEQWAVFQRVRDQIEQRVIEFKETGK